MDYSSYGYHGSKHMTTPRKTCGNIKGLELEIDDYDCGYLLDELVEEDVITVPYNEKDKTGLIITCENDGSVYKELVFKASCNSTLLKGVKKLSNKLNGNVYNSHGTSCHIHINNDYLKSIDVTREDIVKASEFLAPILFKISGRDSHSMLDWAKSTIENKINIYNEDLFKRAKIIDEYVNDEYDARYRIINLNPWKTTELRIFSNYYNFDYDYIKMYLETTDFIIELAEYMKNKSYQKEYDNIIKLSKEFFGKRKFKKISEKHNINRFFLSEKERRLETFKEELNFVKMRINNLKRNWNWGSEITLEMRMDILRMLRVINEKYYIPEIKFNIMDFDLNNIENDITEIIENEIEELEE